MPNPSCLQQDRSHRGFLFRCIDREEMKVFSSCFIAVALDMARSRVRVTKRSNIVCIGSSGMTL